MRLRAEFLLLALPFALPAAELPYFNVMARDPGAWPQVLESIGYLPQDAAAAHILVARAGAQPAPTWRARVEKGAIVVLEGESPLAESFGFKRGKRTVLTTSLRDVHRPTLPIIWEKPLELPVMDLPPNATVFARERWMNAPMTAGMRLGSGAVLWVAASLGRQGFERFPYLLAALADLGLEMPFQTSRLWAFFDSAYRSRVDVDYFAARWRKSGIAALHVAAWHFYEPDEERDEYLKKLIEACHREGILVYAWLELPHVSEKFWDDHPEWREKTAVLQDAKLDWRKLMNLANRDCFHSASEGVKRLISRFGWDGVNLAELYFESLEGMGNPSRFTPVNDDVRAEFKARSGFDPIELFGSRKDEASRRAFLDYRAELARRIQREWLNELEGMRITKPDLDLVLTHVDDRFDNGIRDALGADAARLLTLLDSRQFTFLVEDPATVWNLGPQRYQTIAEKYQALTPYRGHLAIDINIVDRYQDVYPTKQQTGTELFELLHSAAANFARVALYGENSLLAPDLPFLASAAAAVTRVTRTGGKLTIDAAASVGMQWKGPAMLDGQLWPVADDGTIWLPAGTHTLEAAQTTMHGRLMRLNGDLRGARTLPDGSIEFSYHADACGIAIFDRAPHEVRVDGAIRNVEAAGPHTRLLPRGEHLVTIRFD